MRLSGWSSWALGLALLLAALPVCGWCAGLAATQQIAARVHGDILNDGRRADAILTTQPIVYRSPGGKVETGPESRYYLQVTEPRGGKTARRAPVVVGRGVTARMIARDLTGDGTTEVFVFVNGQATYAHVYRFAGGRMKQLFQRGPGGRPHVECRRIPGGRWEIVEHARLDAYDDVPDAIARKAKAQAGKNGIPSIIRIYRWDKRAKRFLLKRIVAEKF